jgi:branched-chain amino acid transport system ATP-binding protein
VGNVGHSGNGLAVVLGSASPASAVLELVNVSAGYGRVPVLHDVNVTVNESAIVAILGANGAGKSTLLKVAAGVVRCAGGSVRLEGRDITQVRPHTRAHQGICLIPGGEGVFRTLTVRENLILGTAVSIAGTDGIERAVEAFPILGQRMSQVAGTLSGGEQQMLALARAYLGSPRVIFADELSLGLAPIVVDQMFESMQALASLGTAMVIVEQYASRALAMADSAYVMAQGSVSWSGLANDLDEETLVASYLGGGNDPL